GHSRADHAQANGRPRRVGSQRVGSWACPRAHGEAGGGLMVVGRRAWVGTRRVQPGGGEPPDGERAASADAAHAAALRLLPTTAPTRAQPRRGGGGPALGGAR